VLAVALVAAAGVAGWMLHGGPTAPVVAEAAPIDVTSGATGSVIDLGDARIESDPATAFTVTRPAGGVLVTMARGVLELEVGKRGDRPPLVVRAGDTEVIVVGTRFSVDYGDGRGEASVRVTEGAVRVVHHQREVRVAAGQAWQAGTGLVAGADRQGQRPESFAAPSTGGDGSAARAHPSGSIAIAISPGPAPDVLHDRKAAVPEAPVGQIGPAPAPPGSPSRSATAPARPAAGDAVRRRPPGPRDPRIDLRSAIRAQPVEGALDLGDADPASAIAKHYDIAAHKSGAAASQAFYSIAVLRHEKLGQHAEALQVLDAYVRRFPGGKEYRAALWLRVRILCLDKIDDRCRAAAYTYLHEAPESPAARVAELVTLSE
jgi:hypothetical protein